MGRNLMRKCRHSGKHCHSEGKAEAQLRSVLLIRPNYEGRVYFCFYCGHWHVGRESKKGHKNKYAK